MLDLELNYSSICNLIDFTQKLPKSIFEYINLTLNSKKKYKLTYKLAIFSNIILTLLLGFLSL